MSTTLVLAGGGPAALAWELGVLRGLADADAELAQKVIGAGTVIGTSGGSSVAAQITSGTPLDELYDGQLSADTAEIEVQLDLTEFMSRFGAAVAGAVDELDRRRRVGAFALAASTLPETKRRAVIAARLPAADWPERALRIPAVDAATGEVVIFTRDSGVTLLDAVAASCAPVSGPRPLSETTATSTAVSAPAPTPTWPPEPIRSCSSPPPCRTHPLRALEAICEPNSAHSATHTPR
ncbi:MAG TPA: patatin-like phospholipase family protein [Streptosporangiaceae bacterium]|jgi:NTE family protein